jgi:hypothetical protein
MLTFRPGYAVAAAGLFLTEVVIAAASDRGFIRLSVGDYLVVILVYCFVRAFVKVGVWRAAIGVLVLAFAVEVSQYFHLIRVLRLDSSRLAHLILGSSFEVGDLFAYALGIGTVLVVEGRRGQS